ncbi:MAG: neuraminidase-like domain-containing protein, partial [Cyanobacteriota bacterium]
AAIRAQLEALQAVPTLMHRSQLSFEQVLECLASTFINPGGVVALADPASCDLSSHRLRGAGPDFFDRLHRFLRLRRCGPWSIAQLDQILTRLGEPASPASPGSTAPRLITDTVLVRLMHLLELQRRLPLALDNLLRLWDPSSTDQDKASLLARALRLRPQDLTTLRRISGIDPFSGPEATQAFLVQVDLVKGSGVLVPQLAYLCLHDPEAAALLAPDRQAIAAVCRTLRAGLQAVLTPPEAPQPPGDQLREALTAELGEPVSIHGLNASQIEVALALLRENWSERTAEARADAELRLAGCFGDFLAFPEALATLLSDQPFSAKASFVLEPLRERQLRRKLEAELMEFLPADAIANTLAFLSSSPEDSEANRDRLRGHVPLLMQDSSLAILLNPSTPLADKFAHLLSCLQVYRQQRDLISQTLADHLKLEGSLVRLLLERVLQPSAPPLNRQAISQLRELSVIDAEDVAVDFITPLLIRLHKIAELCRAFKLTTEELTHFTSLGEESIDLNRIPFAPLDPETPEQASIAMAVLGDWLALLTYRNLRDALPTRAVTLIDVLRHSGDDQDALRKLLVEATGWELADLGDLSTSERAIDPRRVPVLQQRWRQISLSRRLGIGLPQLRRWAQEPPSSGQAREIREAARAKVDAAQWLAIVRPLEDQLRERRRDALVAYLLHHPELWRPSATRADVPAPTVNQLYEHFLIDVEMSACQLTSRIRQAIAAMQLFIQRCQMGLEESELPNELSRQWDTWRKTYRYWEANRKVFLYPENWIEPELRDDKTPFFKDLENALLQNEVTEKVVEDAYLRYLTQLNDVARLEIMGLYVEKEAGVDVLHVFGRTSGIPHHYYYRRRVNSRNWTAWEKVELDIEGDHLIPVVWNRRLHLFWPIFTEKAVQPTTISESEQGTAPLKYWEIGLACSEHRNGQWKAKKLISGKLDWPATAARTSSLRPQKDITFKAFVDADTGALSIFCFSYYRHGHSLVLFPIAAFRLQSCSPTALITLLT